MTTTTVTDPTTTTTTEVGSIPWELFRLAALAEQHPIEAALVMLHCPRDDQASVDRLAAALGLTAAELSLDRDRYSTGGFIGRMNLHVLCAVSEDPHARRDRLAAELTALDAQIGGQS